jgi:heme A synthase
MDLLVLAQQIGDSDCELIDAGDFLAQPVNSLTSLAYVAFGIWVISRCKSRSELGRFTPTVFGLLLVAVGIGSVAFHGPQPVGARFLHDFPIALALLFIVSVDLIRLGVLGERKAVRMSLAVAAIVALVTAGAPDIALLLSAPLIGGAVIAEVMVYRRVDRRQPGSRRVLARRGAMVGVLAVAGVLNLLGRTDGALCDPDSVLQLHGLWHVLTALIFGLWAAVTFPRASA